MPLSLLPPWFLWSFVFVVGIAYGSFGNVLISRLPANQPIGGRSRCPSCGRTLGMLDLFPILSFLFLRGKCRTCKAAISARYVIVELGSGLLFFLALALHPASPLIAVALGASLASLFFAAVADSETKTIPDLCTILVAVFAGIVAVLQGTFDPLAPLIGALFFGLQWAVSRGRWVGSGDVLLAGAIGVLVGTWSQMVVTLFAAYILGVLVTSILLLLGRLHRHDYVPFGPFLAAGAVVGVLWPTLSPLLSIGY